MKSDTTSVEVAQTQWTEANRESLLRPPHLVLVDSDDLACAGARIRAARQRLGLSLEDVRVRTCLPVAILTRIEEMDIEHLPDLAYLRGHLRSVTGAVGLDWRQMVDVYIEQSGLSSGAASVLPRSDHSGLYRGLTVAICVLLLSCAGIFVPRLFTDDSRSVSGLAVQPVDTAGLSELSSPARESLHLVVSRRVGIELRGADGTVFVSRQVHPGEVFAVRRGWLVTAEDGGALFWRLGERDLGPLATDGMRVYALRASSVLDVGRSGSASG